MKYLKNYYLISGLLLPLLFLSMKTEATICSAAIAGKPLEIQNWQGKIDLKGLSISLKSEQVGMIYTYYNNSNKTVYFKLKQNENAYIVNLDQALIFNSYNSESITDFYPFFERGIGYYLVYNYSGSYNLKSVDKAGTTTDMGVLIAKTDSNETPQFIYQDSTGSLQYIDTKLGVTTPYFNKTLSDNIFNIKTYALLLKDGGILYSTSTPCAACEMNIDIIKNNQISHKKGKLSSDYKSLILTSGEIIKIDEFVTSSSKQYFMFENQQVGVGFNGKIVPIMAINTTTSSNSLSYAANYANLLIIKSNLDSQFFIIDSEKIRCQEEEILSSASESKFLKTSYKDQAACDGKASSVADWDDLTKKSAAELLDKKVLNFDDIDFLLQRILRKETLSANEVKFIEYVYNSDAGNSFNDLLVLIIDKFSGKNELKNLTIIKRIPEKSRKLSGKMDNICLSLEIKNSISSSYKNIIVERSKKIYEADKYSFNIQKLLFIKNYLSILSNQDKEDIASDLGTVLAEATQRNDNQLNNVFFSTIDWFSTQRLREFFGLKPIELTDIVITNNDSYVSIIGTKEIFADDSLAGAGVKRTRGGFYITDQQYLSIYDQGTQSFSWLHGNDQFQADVTKAKRPVNFTPELIEGPDKRQMVEDKIFHGAVVIGANIHGPTLKNTIANYMYYFKLQKFTIEQPVVIDRAIDYLKEGITGKKDKLDYFLKEAHSDGDYRNLFSINKKMFLVKAKLQHEEYLEEIDLLYHDDSYDAEFISNQLFGEWLKEREDKYKGGQFIYLNTSCSSYTKAAAEIGTAASKLLTVVASSSSVYTFSTSPDNSTFHLFEGIRKMLPFADISKSISGLKGSYIFPKDAQYKTMVLDGINAGYTIQSKVYKINESGNRELYNIERILNQNRNAVPN